MGKEHRAGATSPPGPAFRDAPSQSSSKERSFKEAVLTGLDPHGGAQTGAGVGAIARPAKTEEGSYGSFAPTVSIRTDPVLRHSEQHGEEQQAGELKAESEGLRAVIAPRVRGNMRQGEQSSGGAPGGMEQAGDTVQRAGKAVERAAVKAADATAVRRSA